MYISICVCICNTQVPFILFEDDLWYSNNFTPIFLYGLSFFEQFGS